MALDGNSLAYRAFFALPEDMTNASGQSTNAVYGFTTMLLNLLKEHKPDGIAVVFDRPEPTFRHEAIPEYKAQREKAPDTLVQQLGLIRGLLDALGISWFELPGFEGDDIIATMADKAEKDGHQIIVVTGDRDSYQLVKDPSVRVLYNKRGVSDYALYDEAGILERTGVTPAMYAEYAALRGDPSDNLAGIPGVGEKTAAKLMTQYGSLAAILNDAEKQTPKLKAGLLEHGERVVRNAEMMVLRRDVPIDIELSNLAPRPDMSAAQQMFDFLEFKTMGKRLRDLVGTLGLQTRGSDVATTTVESSTDVQPVGEVVEASSVDDAIHRLSASKVWAIAPDFVDAHAFELRGLAIATDLTPGSVCYVSKSILNDQRFLKCLVDVPEIVAHDAKAIMRALLLEGVDLRNVTMDTAIASYLVNPSRASYSLADVSLDYLGVAPSAAQVSDGQFDFGGAGEAEALRRSAEEASLVMQLVPRLRDELAAIHNTALYDDVENPLVRVLAKMEFVGIAVDRKALNQIREKLTSETVELTAALHKIAGKEFNLNSPTQLREILYVERGLTPGKKTKTGYSTDAATLEKLEAEWPEFITPLLRYREIEKLRSTYGEGLLNEVREDDRIHATFNQTVARTGRLSSDKPNLHNIPVRTEEGRVFRNAFVAPTGSLLLVADYNQIELRCIAHLAQDPGLITAFTQGEDIHRSTAARVFGVNPEEVTHDQRSKAKMVSYGLAYGMEAYGLSQRLNIGVDEASKILNAYFEAFPSVKKYMDDAIQTARQHGYTETLFGRRRPIPELLSDNFRVRQAGERQAMNAAIQGLAADIFKIALVRLDSALEQKSLASRIVLQVHDEVIVEVPAKEKEIVNDLVLSTMRGAADLLVPLEVNSAWGATWADAKS